MKLKRQLFSPSSGKIIWFQASQIISAELCSQLRLHWSDLTISKTHSYLLKNAPLGLL